MSFENLSPDVFTTFSMLICDFLYIIMSSIETTLKGQNQVTLSPIPVVYLCRKRMATLQKSTANNTEIQNRVYK